LSYFFAIPRIHNIVYHKYGLIEKAVNYYTQNVSDNDKEVTNICLEFIKFGMCNTLITFVDKYYLYDGDLDFNNRGLTVGGFESAWLADLTISYLLETIDQDLFKNVDYFGIYRDDGLAVFKKDLQPLEISNWLSSFQNAINSVAGNNFLQFTAVVWKPNGDGIDNDISPLSDDNKTQLESKTCFPYLDMELFWNEQGTLEFRVHLKPNQQLKYLNKGSSHTPSCYSAISTGVFKRLAKLTSLTDSNKDKSLDELYPNHLKALRSACLSNKTKIPTLSTQQSLMREETSKVVNNEIKKRRERDRRRAFLFKVAYSCFGNQKPIHRKLKEIKDRYKTLKWIRPSMCYHRYGNLRELFQADLTLKLMDGITSKDFENSPCNCRNKSTCPYFGKCRRKIVVYKATCLQTQAVYIGNTQQPLKLRMQQHVGDVKRLYSTGKQSDSFANHFVKLIPPGLARKDVNAHIKIRCEIMWQGNPVHCVKTFNTRACKLCARERLEIIKFSKTNPTKLINSCNEIYGSCRHRTRFHRFYTKIQDKNASTDESDKDKRVTTPSSTTSNDTQTSTFTYASIPDEPDYNIDYGKTESEPFDENRTQELYPLTAKNKLSEFPTHFSSWETSREIMIAMSNASLKNAYTIDNDMTDILDKTPHPGTYTDDTIDDYHDLRTTDIEPPDDG
jgi:hypothetical protein